MLDRAAVDEWMALDRDDVLSVYLDVDPADPANSGFSQAWRSWLNDALGSLSVEGPRDRQMTLRALKDEADKLLSGYRPGGKGHVLFLAPGMQDSLDLPLRLENRVHFGRIDVLPLLWLLDEYQRYGILRVDHETATFYTAHLGRINPGSELSMELDTGDWSRKDLMPATSYGRELTAGSHRDAFEDRVAENQKRFFKEVTEAAAEWSRKARLDRIVLGGDEQAAAALRSEFPTELADRVIGSVPLPQYENDKDMEERVRSLAETHEREAESSLVEEIVGAAKSGGNGALGTDDVLGSLVERRAHTVAAVWPLEGSATVCGKCGFATGQTLEACPVCGGDTYMEPLAETLSRLSHAAGSSVEWVRPPAAEQLRAVGGVGARLRF